jgi:peroxiredoxin
MASSPVASGFDIPKDIKLFELAADVPKPLPVMSGELFAPGKTIVIVGIPGAYTPTCSAKHIPGVIQVLGDFKSKGAEVAILAVNDPFVMHAFKQTYGAPAEAVRFLSDANAELSKALGVAMDMSGAGLGVRCRRFGMLVKDGKVTHINVEQPGEFVCTDGKSLLRFLD